MALIHLLDRIGSPTALYALLALATWQFHNTSKTWTYGFLVLLSAWYIKLVATSIIKENKLSKLGSRAPALRTWTPFNVQFIIKAVYLVVNHRAHEFWWSNFAAASEGRKESQWTFETIAMGDRLVLTADDENIKAILATQFGSYGKGPQFRKEWKDFLGLSIFTTDGELWHNARQLLRPQFIKDRVSDLQTFEAHVQVLLPLLAGSANGSTVRADDLFFRYTLDAATDFLLGGSVNSLHQPNNDFAEAFTKVQHVQGLIARAGPLQGLVPKKAFHQGLKVLNTFIDKYIDQALALSPEELEKRTKSDEGYTFLHAIASYTRNRAVLRDQIVAVLLAGRDTTAVTLSWLFYELSKHPEVVSKLRQEISTHVGLSTDKTPTYSDLKNMRYLQHTLNEILRLYPVVPYNVRVALEDTTLPHGGGPDGSEPIAVLKDTPIGYSTLVMQRRPDTYPEASASFPHYLEFVPERWDTWQPKHWQYVPFNGGPRICIGQQFALTEMAYTVVRILQRFGRIEERGEGFPGLRTDIVLQPAKGVHVAFFEGEKA